MRQILWCGILQLILIGSINTSAQNSNLEVEGTIKIGNIDQISPSPGTIRFNPETSDFEGWNGLYWISITGFQHQTGSVTDVDGNVYTTINIGNQEWMAENLTTTKFRNGDPIVSIMDSATWSNTILPGYCWYDNDPSMNKKFGRLYNWYAAGDVRGICPTGWRLPRDDVANNDSDWYELQEYLGISDHGPKLREAGAAHWAATNNGTNSSGFTARGGGQRFAAGRFGLILGRVSFWSDRENETSAYSVNLTPTNNLGRSLTDKKYGYAIRCIKE